MSIVRPRILAFTSSEASFALMDRCSAAGELPMCRRLRDTGTWGQLKSAAPYITLAQAAVRFALQQPDVSTALIAAVTIEQLEENLAVLAAPCLTEQEMLLARGLGIPEPRA